MSALAAAQDVWSRGEVRDPGAWLYRAASNHLLGALRQQANRARLLETYEPEPPRFHDDLLRMLFACCDEAIPPESRLVVALKLVCGFSTDEIAQRLFATEANVHKRLQRARSVLRDLEEPAAVPASVHEILYLLFNEGYLSNQAEHAVRRELCDEAIRLTTLLAEHAVATPETYALLALMHLHAARFASRTDDAGGLVLLEDQDRSQWNREQLEVGAAWLARAAQGEELSRFHAEAGIAAEHAFAPSFAATRWSEIAALYALLEPSPLHTLNRAIAIAEWQGPVAALAVLAAMEPPVWLVRSYLWDAVLADLHRRAGHPFAEHRERALAAAPSEAIRAALTRRLAT